MSAEAVKEIEGLLEAEVAKERASNDLTMKVGGGFALFVAAYLGWMTWNVSTLLDPEGLALAASGFAIGAVPDAGKEVHKLVVEGAPDLVRLGSNEIIGMVPGYRLQLQAEIDPVLDEVCVVLANAAVKKLAEAGGDPNAKYDSSDALQAGADAAVGRVNSILDDAMDLPDDEGVTARQRIEQSLKSLKKIDAQLKIMNRKGGDPQERELLVAWLGIVAQHTEAAEVALVEDYKASARAQQAAEPKADAPATPAPK